MKRILCICLCLMCLLSGFTACKTEPKPVNPDNCKHEKHDPETTRCLVCNRRIDHHYVGDTCTLCGKKTEFLWDCIKRNAEVMDILKSGGHENKGTVERMTYETFAYNIQSLTGEEEMIEKEAFVYLPYGYDPEKSYNVLFLLHGSTDQAGYWLAQEPYHADDSTYVSTGNYTKEMLDYLIGTGKAEPCIVVTPSLYNDHDNYKKENKYVAANFGHELTEYLLPAVVERYSTYARTMDEVTAQREHFAYAGLSLGSMTSFTSIMTYCLPYFAYIGSFSGPATDVDVVIEALNGPEKDYDIAYWYCAIGDQDKTGGDFYGDVHKTYKKLVAGVDRLVDGQNCDMVDVYGANHTYECWLTCLYNALPKFFR